MAPTTSHMDDMVTHEDSWKPMAWIYEISFYYFTTIGCTCSFVVAIATSYLIPGEMTNVDRARRFDLTLTVRESTLDVRI